MLLLVTLLYNPSDEPFGLSVAAWEDLQWYHVQHLDGLVQPSVQPFQPHQPECQEEQQHRHYVNVQENCYAVQRCA